MKKILIRAATLEDAESIFAVHQNSVENLCNTDYGPEQIAMWLDGRLPETYRAAIVAGSLWLAYTDSLQGFVEIDGHQISKLFVRGDAAGQGIGARLLCEALQHIQHAGHAKAYLEATLPWLKRHNEGQRPN
ncbi:GNAT family N-acetyltransferase [Pseudomonas sp. TWRC1-2]|uniref:GNAT family N-acetyltransferase n=1 Tax=Pseudomonas sp. TWRC1-2 TaxID=2804628 RepID=UPI003CE96DE3